MRTNEGKIIYEPMIGNEGRNKNKVKKLRHVEKK